MHLVLIETSGNQAYIFATNKLRENVGASELTYRVGTEWALNAVRDARGPDLWNDDVKQLRENLVSSALNPPITQARYPIEVIVATSGKMLFLSASVDKAKEVIARLTTTAVEKSPGIDVFGVISDPIDWSRETLDEVTRKLSKKYELHRSLRPSPDLRFMRLPIVDECATSGLPAAQLRKSPGEEVAKPRSKMSLAKDDAKWDAYTRIQRQFPGLRLEPSISELEKHCEWLAIVHADGNGMGNIFVNFGEYAKCNTPVNNPSYVDKLRRFSIALDVCTEKAFSNALGALTPTIRNKDSVYPVVPIVLGGDDLTVVCDGRSALRFAHDFLVAFEEETAKRDAEHGNGVVTDIAETAFKLPSGKGHLAACAGVAIIKPHFPFSSAYNLAERLIESAKGGARRFKKEGSEIQWPCSAIDFHILFDSSGSDLERIRPSLEVDDRTTRLYARPYVVTKPENFEGANAEGRDWATPRLWKQLDENITLLDQPRNQDDPEGPRTLPTTQMHELREGLFLGREVASARFELIRQRYKENGIEQLLRDGKLFWEEKTNDGRTVHVTGLLDALDAFDFLEVRK